MNILNINDNGAVLTIEENGNYLKFTITCENEGFEVLADLSEIEDVRDLMTEKLRIHKLL